MLKSLGMRLPKFNNPLEKLRQEVREEIDIVKSRMDIPDDLFEKFQDERGQHAYRSVFDLEKPLVSVCTTTYNRGSLLVERSVKSILSQDYSNLELIVVGDCCTDETVDLIGQIRDERLRFVNLAERGSYPENNEWRWMVAGCAPFNRALSMARGDFVTHLDDDDEHSPDRISKLVRLLQETRADMAWHPFWYETPEGKWELNPAENFRFAQVSTSSIFYHNWFKCILGDVDSYRLREPGDWNRFRKFRYLGANAVRHPEPFLRHYKERNQKKR